MTESLKDWLYIARRFVQVAFASMMGVVRSGGPFLTMSLAMMFAYGIGAAGASAWLVLVPMLFGGFALGMMEDRGEARATTKFGGRILDMISGDHSMEIIVTHKSEVTQSAPSAMH